ncbi:MAG: flagellin [bacterium]
MYTNGFTLNTNMASLLVQRNFNNATNDISVLMEHLSTNMRVNRSSDDPSGMALSNNLRKQISSIAVAKTNSQTGVSMLQTAEGDLNTIKNNLTTMKSLIIQAKTGTVTTAQRAAYNATYQSAVAEINRIATSSNYSNIKLLDGTNSTASSIVLQVDINNSADNKIDISSSFSRAVATALGISATSSISTVSFATTAETQVNTAYDKILLQIAQVGGFASRLNSNIARLDVKSENLQASDSVIRDADIASDTAKLTKKQILQQTSASLLQQANQSSSLILTLISRY